MNTWEAAIDDLEADGWRCADANVIAVGVIIADISCECGRALRVIDGIDNPCECGRVYCLNTMLLVKQP